MMWFILFLAGIFARADEVMLHGRKIQAHALSYHFTGEVADFIVDAPVQLDLARGNQILATGWVAVQPNGDVSIVAVAQAFEAKWKMFDGRTVTLNCDPHPLTPTQPAHPRLVQFYYGGEYMSGCETIKDLSFTTDFGSLTVAGELEATSDFHLLAASRVTEGFLTINDQMLTLEKNSAVRFYQSGAVNYFTPVDSTTYHEQHPLYGVLRFQQVQHGKPTSMSFAENGLVETGLLADPLPVPGLKFTIPAGSGVVFTNDSSHVLKGAKFITPVHVATQAIQFEASSFISDIVGGFTQFRVASETSAVDPESGARVSLATGAEIWLFADGAVAWLVP